MPLEASRQKAAFLTLHQPFRVTLSLNGRLGTGPRGDTLVVVSYWEKPSLSQPASDGLLAQVSAFGHRSCAPLR
jgi:hypothetical protein